MASKFHDRHVSIGQARQNRVAALLALRVAECRGLAWQPDESMPRFVVRPRWPQVTSRMDK
jgi:hypothetical protein